MILTPFGRSLSKPRAWHHQPFDKLRANGEVHLKANGEVPFGLSLSKPSWHARTPFDRLRAIGDLGSVRTVAS